MNKLKTMDRDIYQLEMAIKKAEEEYSTATRAREERLAELGENATSEALNDVTAQVSKVSVKLDGLRAKCAKAYLKRDLYKASEEAAREKREAADLVKLFSETRDYLPELTDQFINDIHSLSILSGRFALAVEILTTKGSTANERRKASAVIRECKDRLDEAIRNVDRKLAKVTGLSWTPEVTIEAYLPRSENESKRETVNLSRLLKDIKRARAYLKDEEE